MAVDMFLNLDGITGESVDSEHAEQIDVLAWSWEMEQSGSMHQGGGGGSGKVTVKDLVVTKYVDASSPTLMMKCCSGAHIASGELYVRKAGDTPLEYLVITMTDIIITSVSTGGSGGEDRLTEVVKLNFAQVATSYTPQGADGTGGAAVDMCWNIAQNTAC